MRLKPGAVQSIVIATLLSTGLLGGSAQAETVYLGDDANLPSNTEDGVKRPVRGMNRDKVRASFGEPAQTITAVGQPPITRWVYDKFTVYYEGDWVIHSVVHR